MVRALASHQRGPGSIPNVDSICGLSLLLVLSLAPRGFSLGTSVSPLLKNQHFQIPILTTNQVDGEPLSGCSTSKSFFFIYLFFFLFIYFTYEYTGLLTWSMQHIFMVKD